MGNNYRGKHNNNRGRGRGGRGRGGGGGGRGRNRELIPSSVGFLYRPQSNVDDYDDFRIYAQFGSDSEEEQTIKYPHGGKSKKKNNKKKNNLGFIRESVPSFGADEERPGLGMSHRSNERFADGKSKYFKTVAFTRSNTTLNLDQASTSISETEISQITVGSSTNDVVDKLSELKINESHDDQVTQTTITETESAVVTVNNEIEEAQSDEENDSEEKVQFNGKDDYEDDDDSEEEDIVEFFDSDDDEELLQEDMQIMADYIENIDDGEIEDLNELLAWSQMQNNNEELESDFSYSDLDTLPQVGKKKKKNRKGRTDFEDEEEFILRDSEAFVDPEIFQQTMINALSEVPPSLKPGMRRWYEKQQRKEQLKKKKEEEKARRKKEKERALKGKGKNKYSDSDLSTQMTKIDDRIRDFINDATITSFQFAPMNKTIRREVHMLAKAYQLESKSIGGGTSRATIITKTSSTRIPNDRRTIDRYLINVQTNLDDQFRIQQKKRNPPLPPRMKSNNKKSNSGSKNNNNNNTSKPANSAIPKHGTIVGQNAAPISENNVGHRMLAAMGWKQGDALGANSDGIVAPIEAVIRKKGLGLGS